MATTDMETLAKLSKAEYLDHSVASENPVLIRGERHETLYAAYHALTKLILTLKKNHNLSDEEVDVLIDLVREVYFKKKAESFFNARLDTVAMAIRNLLEHYLDDPIKKRDKSSYYCSLIRHSYKDEF